ncbi:hypothetical protein H5410_030963 [Solanum commersonii]|uniref:Uncharacterized protein n=1 Tax=Solanum commersonii TaxID=4109 RepID=A0A9J5YH50_SOLCO|nr:hypothetical protein H5410_030963 [Solanum commersonii]
MVMIYQFKAIKETHLIMLEQASYHGRHTLMQVQATQGRVLLLNPRNHEMVWPHQVKVSCRHTLMLDQANFWKDTISQSKAIHEFYYLKLPCMVLSYQSSYS